MWNSRQARKRIGNIAQITSESFRDYRFFVAGKRHLSWPEAAGPDGSWSWYIIRKELQMKHFPPRQRFNSHYIHVLILIEFNTILQRLCDTWTVLYTPKPRIDAMSFLCCATSHWILIHTSGGRENILDSKESFMNNEWITRELLASLLSCFVVRSEDFLDARRRHHSWTICFNFKHPRLTIFFYFFRFYWMFLMFIFLLAWHFSLIAVLLVDCWCTRGFCQFFLSSTIYRLVKCQWHFWVVKNFFGHLAFFVKLSANPM